MLLQELQGPVGCMGSSFILAHSLSMSKYRQLENNMSIMSILLMKGNSVATSPLVDLQQNKTITKQLLTYNGIIFHTANPDLLRESWPNVQ